MQICSSEWGSWWLTRWRKRLSAAGRLLIIVLDKSQAPSTYFQRTMAAHYERLNVQNERLHDAIDTQVDLRGCIDPRADKGACP